MSTRASSHLATIRGRLLLLARAVWIVVAVTVLAIMVFSVPSSYEYYSEVCTATPGVCSGPVIGQTTPVQATPEGLQALQDAGLSVRFYAISNVVIDKVFQLVWFAVGALIFWRRSDDRMALLTSLFLVTFGTVTVDPAAAISLVSSQPAWWLPVRGVELVGYVCSALFFFLFPGGRFVPSWTRWLAVAFVALNLFMSPFAGSYASGSALETISYLVFVGGVASLVWAQVYRYRRVSSPAQRQQTRWVVFGTTLGIAGTFPTRLPVDLSLVDGNTPLMLLLLEAGFSLSFLLLPLSIGVAVLRSHLFDVDVLINRTIVYLVLSAALVGTYFGGIVLLQRAFLSLTGQERLPQLAVVASTLVIAALFDPLRRRIQSFIDRRFYRKKYDARKALEGFSAKLRNETDLDALSEDLVSAVRETVQPAHASLWLRPRAEANRGMRERAV
ncbi:MAG TPA: hypothetical protein VFY59_14090 [Rubrobacter sp.]|nr:hypothetical protein [Rubrobacter sp.]